MFTSFVAAASTSTPPALEVSAIAASSVPCALVTTIVSEVPTLEVSDIAEAALSFDTKATWPPAMFTSFVAAASTSTPPALEVSAIASNPVPVEEIKTLASTEPVKEIDKSSAALLAALVSAKA